MLEQSLELSLALFKEVKPNRAGVSGSGLDIGSEDWKVFTKMTLYQVVLKPPQSSSNCSQPFFFFLPIARKKEYLYGFALSILVLLQCDCSCNKTVDCGVFDDSWLFVCWGATKIVEKHSVEVLWCWYHFRISVIATQPHRGLVLPIYFSKKNDKSGTSGNRLCFWRGLYFVLPLKSSVGICANCVF